MPVVDLPNQIEHGTRIRLVELGLNFLDRLAWQCVLNISPGFQSTPRRRAKRDRGPVIQATHVFPHQRSRAASAWRETAVKIVVIGRLPRGFGVPDDEQTFHRRLLLTK